MTNHLMPLVWNLISSLNFLPILNDNLLIGVTSIFLITGSSPIRRAITIIQKKSVINTPPMYLVIFINFSPFLA